MKNNNFSIFFGAIFTIGSLIGLFQNSNRFLFELEPILGGDYGYSTGLMTLFIGWFLLLFGVLNKLNWSKLNSNNSSEAKRNVWTKLSLKNKIAIIISVLFFASISVVYSTIEQSSLNQKIKDFNDTLEKTEIRLKELESKEHKNLDKTISDSSLKSMIFSSLKNAEYHYAESVSSKRLGKSDEFSTLLQALSEFGVDSLKEASKTFEKLKTNTSSDCNVLIAVQFQEMIKDNAVDKEFRQNYLKNFMKYLEFNDVSKVCEILNTPSTYDVNVE